MKKIRVKKYAILFFALIQITSLSSEYYINEIACSHAAINTNTPNVAPITVMDTIRMTLSTHRELKALQENREVALHELRRSRAGWGPSIDFTARAGTSRLSTSTTRDEGVADDFYDASRIGAVFVQPIWDGNQTCGRVLASQSLLDAVTHRIIDNANSLALEGLIAHVDLLWRNEVLKLAEQNVYQHERILRATKERAALGADTIGEVAQTEGRLSRAKSTQISAQSSLHEGENSYLRLTKMATVPVNLAAVPEPTIIYAGPAEALLVAQKHNPKILSHLAQIQQAKGEKERTESALYPSFSIEASPYYESRGGGGDQWSSNIDIMGVMRWNIFNSGADMAATKASESRIREARQEAFNIKDTTDLALQDTWIKYREALEQIEHYEDSVTHYTITRDTYLDQFTMGRRSLLDVLDAEAELFNAATQLATAQSNIVITSYKMLALTGMLLQELGINSDDYLVPDSDEDEKLQQHPMEVDYGKRERNQYSNGVDME